MGLLANPIADHLVDIGHRSSCGRSPFGLMRSLKGDSFFRFGHHSGYARQPACCKGVRVGVVRVS